MEAYRRIPLWKDVPQEQWETYRWQMANRIQTVEQLRQVIRLSPTEEQAATRRSGRFIMGIPPYWAALMDPDDPTCPIRRQAVPVEEEYRLSPNDMIDPLGEDSHMPVPGLVHRYPDRVLLLVVEVCSMYCRFCTRSRVVGTSAGFSKPANIDVAIDYIKAHRKIRDVLISGGDPLTLSDERLDEVITKLRSIPHVEFIRIGTRNPVTLPYRVTESLCAVLQKHKPVWMSLHFNHPKEVTPAVRKACGMLADSGVPLGSQTVLLKGINDRPAIMKKLFHELLKTRVRPYYIYQCDPVKGTAHFRTPVAAGLQIIEKLRGHTSGYAVPTFVVDGPGGGGKIPLMPNYVVSVKDGVWTLRNFAGKIFTYREEQTGVRSPVVEPSYALIQ
ncbi:MAG: KamA family radical SAM protein [Candidatus Omnitrophica bacterium]|nr:KamA family radical SAM protein [Candidatus Omnitrophota bacterium]MBI2174881.1 KamA family radical SAM protein [Candidatus Omnitrophota bacterium]MBI3009577.1 KamA family radical SAM protein [Candidatus Omnitrophota bacterium]